MRKEHKQYALILGLSGILYVVWPSEVIDRNSSEIDAEVADATLVVQHDQGADESKIDVERRKLPDEAASGDDADLGHPIQELDRPREFEMERIVQHNPFGCGDAILDGLSVTDAKTGPGGPARVSAIYGDAGLPRGKKRVTALVNQSMVRVGERLGRRQRVVSISDSGVAILSGD